MINLYRYTLHRIYKNRYGDDMRSTYWLFLTPTLLLYKHEPNDKWGFEDRDEENKPISSEDLFG